MARRMEREMLFYLCQLADTDKVFVDIRIGFQTEEAIFVFVLLQNPDRFSLKKQV